MPKERDTAIDALKGLLVLSVVYAHNTASYPFVLEFTHPAEMGMFFMVSGYLIHGKLKLYQRLRGTLFPFLFFVAISICWRYGYGFISHEPMAWKRWGMELLQGKDWDLNIPLWFLITYAQLLIGVGILQRLSGKGIRWVITLCFTFVGTEMLRRGFNPLYMGRTLEYLPFFMVGAELQRFKDRFPQGKSPALTWLAVSLLIAVRIVWSPTDYYVRWFVDSTMGLVLSYFLYNLFKTRYFPTRFFAYYGRNSIVVLSVHILWLDVVWRFWYMLLGAPNLVGGGNYDFDCHCITLPML